MRYDPLIKSQLAFNLKPCVVQIWSRYTSTVITRKRSYDPCHGSFFSSSRLFCFFCLSQIVFSFLEDVDASHGRALRDPAGSQSRGRINPLRAPCGCAVSEHHVSHQRTLLAEAPARSRGEPLLSEPLLGHHRFLGETFCRPPMHVRCMRGSHRRGSSWARSQSCDGRRSRDRAAGFVPPFRTCNCNESGAALIVPRDAFCLANRPADLHAAAGWDPPRGSRPRPHPLLPGPTLRQIPATFPETGCSPPSPSYTNA